MPQNFDTRNFTDAKREQIAWRIHESKTWRLPELRAWNYSLCRVHARGWDEEVRQDNGLVVTHKVFDRPKPGCRKCGIHFRRHQHISIAWLYMKKKALLADTMGPQPLDARVLTPTGWATIGDVAVGDEVVDPATGASTRVAEVLSQGIRPIYRLTFTDGSSTRAADTHLWEVTTADDKAHGRPRKIRTTAQLLESGLKLNRGNNRWYVPMTEPVDLTGNDDLPLDPYTVGVLVGDGTFAGSVRVSTDHEIVESMPLPGEVEVKLVSQKDAAYSADFRLTGMSSYARAIGLTGRSETKIVPEAYLWTSVSNRISLLQGLLDTDGTTSGHGIEWGTTSPELADQMGFLVNSLGGTYNRTEKIPTYRHRGEKQQGQLFYRFHIALPGDIAPFRLRRKADRYVPPTKYQPTRGIVSIEFDGEEPVQCIRVESSEHLYVTDDFIVTHNSGKTTSAGGLLAMMAETGELSLFRERRDPFGGMGRAIIVPRAPALYQWQAELHRMMPTLPTLIAEGTAKKRKELYLQPWKVLLIGPEMLRMDYELLERFDLSLMLTDDVDQLRNPDNKTSYVIDRLGGRGTEGLRPGTDRFVIMTGTPLQKRLPELHAVLDGLGAATPSMLGDLDTFTRRHVRTDTVTQIDPKTGLKEKKKVIVGYRNLDVVKRKIAPLYLRRTADDLEDVDLPTIMTNDVFLDLYPRQRAKYDELKRGVLKIMKEEGTQTKHPKALAQLHYGAAICAGLAALGEEDSPLSSVKMDWIQEQLTEGELEDEKVVIFANLKNSIRALQNRLRREGIGFVTVWGDEPDKKKRAAAQERFWEDPKCRVLLGTRAIEQSLNLQVSRHLINVDMILNPARMEQLAGRIRRDGSAYQHVYVHNLLTNNTQEARYLPLLEREAALAAHIWDENSQLFKALSPMALLQLISG